MSSFIRYHRITPSRHGDETRFQMVSHSRCCHEYHESNLVFSFLFPAAWRIWKTSAGVGVSEPKNEDGEHKEEWKIIVDGNPKEKEEKKRKRSVHKTFLIVKIFFYYFLLGFPCNLRCGFTLNLHLTASTQLQKCTNAESGTAGVEKPKISN